MSDLDERYPRPLMVREGWTDLCGVWRFAVDDDDRGLRERWQLRTDPYDRAIVVPFPPESAMSGVHDPAPHPVVWYRREVSVHGLTGGSDRLVLHLGAVDHRATVWVDGQCAGGHEGGHTPFSLDVTDLLTPGAPTFVVVVRAEDPVADPCQPRGKQTWLAEASGLHHPRTTGIWQPVWLERRPEVAVTHLTWTPDLPGARVGLAVELSRGPREPVRLTVVLRLGDEVLAEQSVRVVDAHLRFDVALPALADGRQHSRLLWSPEHPTLLDAEVRLHAGDAQVDRVTSYVGLRSTAAKDGVLLLNGRPYALRAVLAQGLWPASHLAAPSPQALRREVELVRELGFTGVRVHQKVEDPRFLHWCDRLGVVVWAEMPSAYAFAPRAVQRLTAEWLEVLRRDASHPSIVAWVPLNESWGVPQAEDVAAQRSYASALAALTRAVDPTRPVVSNDGWEHVDSDIVGIHDYSADPEDLARRYGSRQEVDRLLAEGRPWRRRVSLPGQSDRGQPVVLSEFGGTSWGPADSPEAWGYSTVQDGTQFLARLEALFSAVRSAGPLAGSCYTQLTDTATETNGLLDAERRPKLPMAVLRAAVTGTAAVAAPRQALAVVPC